MAPLDNRALHTAVRGEGGGNLAESALTALALQAKTREPAAIRQFLQAIAPSVRGVCRAALGAGHPDLEDTVQDCLIDILRALPNYRSEGKIEHYTNRITLRNAIAARKRGRNHERRLRALAAERPAVGVAGRQESLPDLWFLREVLDELSTVQAEAVMMRIVLGYSVEEMAVAMQVSVNTSKSRLRSAKEHMRHRLNVEERLGHGGRNVTLNVRFLGDEDDAEPADR